MGKIREVQMSALIAGITFSDSSLIEKILKLLEDDFGHIEIKSDIFDFDMTDYYTEEMGKNLKKFFCCFTKPINPGVLPDIKLRTNEIELGFTEVKEKKLIRKINIDPGYVTLAKLVLASTKDYSHRIFIGKDIYAETTLRFIYGSFVPVDTTYPDYKIPLSIEFFSAVRDFVKRYKNKWIQEKE